VGILAPPRRADLGFLVCVTIVAEVADGLGVFSTLAQGAARLAQGSVLGLWLLIVGVAVTSTAVLSLDTTAVLVTPVVLALARQLASTLPSLPIPPCGWPTPPRSSCRFPT
jgi:arsenical pump membrane protein